ncbi:Homeodomain-like DNA binding domain-containing transcription factor [Phycomyces blakesleeanus NRRL 1555(-)]|uniref:Homeodomain-like DNA binding domain-containing transcription factor n=1 Tax=Phycomyces blakesleeanus (strain ATCC 8743b / DSM 1359 / FGSC 10004 / NBRC 33097 / NRRL 1555) TaxID=763407 RepID=A0A163AE73_PHYB8|nr:Homeodomain-like DNA binding domain-containing transcription factor [Phycomyces blakesleeanus NRRL 1555(-)]OAD72861.1 Homeodomain-like DNA binding domain-containing transcription factor [Phycomyces blakesleeanus NRRL 1555(-)]|eukprot:XP_018290901.1 Homeodomain-like DNA binding domain-containing transcription factor [Phycomyces blakesleeanus NRRL 1555(-)]
MSEKPKQFQSNEDPAYDSGNDSWSPKIKNRRRFSATEAALLERRYAEEQSPSQHVLQGLADQMSTPRKTITTWFQNRRAKYKRRSYRNKQAPEKANDSQQKTNDGSPGQRISSGYNPPEYMYQFQDISGSSLDSNERNQYVLNQNPSLCAWQCYDPRLFVHPDQTACIIDPSFVGCHTRESNTFERICFPGQSDIFTDSVDCTYEWREQVASYLISPEDSKDWASVPKDISHAI